MKKKNLNLFNITDEEEKEFTEMNNILGDNFEHINHCIVCGQEQQILGKIDYFCERCGAENLKDGGARYDGSRRGIEEMERKINDYDDLNNK